jgi:hypothetical protein
MIGDGCTMTAINVPPRNSSVTIVVIRHRWWWEVRYLGGQPRLSSMNGISMLFLYAQSVLSGFSFYLFPLVLGRMQIAETGCGSCHMIPGITGAGGLAGPPLNQIGRGVFVAGPPRNTPDNMIMWLREPQAIVPGNAMPNIGQQVQQARDVAAYLSTLR